MAKTDISEKNSTFLALISFLLLLPVLFIVFSEFYYYQSGLNNIHDFLVYLLQGIWRSNLFDDLVVLGLVALTSASLVISFTSIVSFKSKDKNFLKLFRINNLPVNIGVFLLSIGVFFVLLGYLLVTITPCLISQQTIC